MPLDLWKVSNPSGSRGLIAVDKVGNKILFFDSASYDLVAEIPSKNHHELTLSPNGKHAYVSDFGKFVGGKNIEPGRSITIVDLEDRSVVGAICTEPSLAPHAMRFDQSGQLWVVCEESGSLLRVDVNSRMVLQSVDLGNADCRPHFLEITPNGEKIYVSSKNGPIVVVSVLTGDISSRIDVPTGTEGITISPDGKRMVTAENTRQELLVIDCATDRVSDIVPLQGAVMSSPKRSRLIRMLFSPDGQHLVSTNYASGIIHIHDGNNLRDQTMIAVAKGPQGLCFTPDGKRAVVANHDSGSATIVDVCERKVIGWFEAGNGIENLTFY